MMVNFNTLKLKTKIRKLVSCFNKKGKFGNLKIKIIACITNGLSSSLVSIVDYNLNIKEDVKTKNKIIKSFKVKF